MAKTTPQRRKQQQTRETNWLVIGSLIAVGILVFGGLIYLALRPTESVPVQTLAEYCAEFEDRCAVNGEAGAPVTMVEVSDFGCPHCQTFHNETAGDLKAQYVDTGTMRWVALPYSLNPTTLAAAASALCAKDQDSYFEYTNALFTVEPSTTRLSMPGFQQAAEAVGLDVDQFTSCVNSERYVDTINNNNQAASRVGVGGTPTFFLNDEELSGAQPLAAFGQAIESLLAAQ